jgi:ribonuclease D
VRRCPVLQVLGTQLNKDQQRSDWEQRPLSCKQAVYAAADAYVLLALMERLTERVGREAAAQHVAQLTAAVDRQ